MENVFVERAYGQFTGEADDILVQYQDVVIRFPVPYGHNADDIDVEFSRGDGWERPKENKNA